MQINPLLQNLIEQYFGSLDEIPPDLSQFVQTVNNLFVSVSMDAGSGTPPSTQLPDVSFSDKDAEKQTAIGQQISTELAGADTQQEVFNILVAQLQKNMGFLSVQVFGYTPGSSTLTLLAIQAAEDFPAQSPSSAGSIQASAESKTTLATRAGTPENPTGVLYPEIAVPMHSRGQVFGVLNVHVESNESLNNQNRFFLEMLTSQLTLVLPSISQRQSNSIPGAEPQLAPEMTSAANWRSFKERPLD